jgi:ankyrin repeat protein
MAAALIRRGARREATNKEGMTALEFALAQHGCSSIAAQLRGGVAREWRKELEATRMLDAGARVDATDCEGMTPLATAASWGSTEGARALLAAGADINFRGRSSAFSCVSVADVARGVATGGLFLPHTNSGPQWGSSEAKEAARRGPPFGDRNFPAVTLALRQERYETALFLLVMGADPNLGSRDFDTTPLMTLARGCEPGPGNAGISPMAMAAALIHAGARREATNKGGMTALEFALSKYGCSSIAPQLRSVTSRERPRPSR